MANSPFTYSQDDLKQLVTDVLAYAKQKGATAADAEVSEGAGHTVSVRLGETETIEYHRDKGFGITVYVGQAKGHASTGDFSKAAIESTVDAALNIARYTAADPFSGLADADMLATEFPDLDLFHPSDISVEASIALAKRCEDAARAVDSRITNSDGASLSTQSSHFVYGNSLGFLAGIPTSRHSLSCAVIGEEGDSMQRDYWYDSCRQFASLASPESIGHRCGERTIRRLNARKVPTTQVPVLFEAPIAASLIGHFLQGVSGTSLYRQASFLLDSLGTQVFSPIIELQELPFIRQGQSSTSFDDEGVATKERYVVKNGVVEGYFLGSYSARKLGMKSTGNAGGSHNLVLSSTGESFDELLRKMGTGLLVTELMGHGTNIVTGDYSRGAAGFWVENGVIAYPVEEITIAGNLKDIFKGILAVGNDHLPHSSRQTGSILVEKMTVAGN
ncbi:metalloprotease PmbA [Leeia sp. TBRC 13508]|uniref:Metalloprotease PmbA n=1 Tax=Leeia speluncae TaxID=2884804 RepID=A0ABS8D9W9_9NEIS|nr:metalloprotease PmbA [Leeia speluncae]MCB6184398.1 metalloprotease PmbA [Leeia speluncae]